MRIPYLKQMRNFSWKISLGRRTNLNQKISLPTHVPDVVESLFLEQPRRVRMLEMSFMDVVIFRNADTYKTFKWA